MQQLDRQFQIVSFFVFIYIFLGVMTSDIIKQIW